MKNRNLTNIILLSMLLFIPWLTGCRKDVPEKETPIESSVTSAGDFYQQVRQAGKMEFATLKLQKTITTDRTAWYKVGSRVAAYSYDIMLSGYMDLTRINEEDIEVDEANKRIYMRLPPVETEVTGRSPELRKEYEHIGLLRSHPDSRERAQLKEMADADFEKEMKSDPEYLQQLRTTAGRKARQWFIALGAANGYAVEFKESLKVQSGE